MVLHLAEQLEVPLRERNQLLLAAGYAPVYAERPLDDAGDGAGARGARPHPRRRTSPTRRSSSTATGTCVAANGALGAAARGRRAAAARAAGQRPAPRAAPRRARAADPQPRRVARAPAGPARAARRSSSAIRSSATLHAELAAYPGGPRRGRGRAGPRRARCGCATGAGELAFFSTVTAFGTAVDVTLSELAIETFFPADAATAAAVREHAEALSAPR